VDIGATKIASAVITDPERVEHVRCEQLPTIPLDAEELAACVLDHLRKRIRAARKPEAVAVCSFGVAEDGTVRWVRRGMRGANHWPSLVENELGVKCAAVLNDAHAAALAEHQLGALRGVERGACLTLGTGLGAGLILGGEVFASEAWLLCVDDPDRNPGGWDADSRVSGTGLSAAAHELAAERPDSTLARLAKAGELTGAKVGELARVGDALAAEAVRRVGRDLGTVCVSLGGTLLAERICVAGGLSALGELLLQPARERIAELGDPDVTGALELRVARFGAHANLPGVWFAAHDAASQLS